MRVRVSTGTVPAIYVITEVYNAHNAHLERIHSGVLTSRAETAARVVDQKRTLASHVSFCQNKQWSPKISRSFGPAAIHVGAGSRHLSVES